MCMCMYVYMYIYIYICIYVYMCLHVYVCICVCTYICMYMSLYGYMDNIWIHVYIYIYVCVCVCVCVCVLSYSWMKKLCIFSWIKSQQFLNQKKKMLALFVQCWPGSSLQLTGQQWTDSDIDWNITYIFIYFVSASVLFEGLFFLWIYLRKWKKF